MAVAHLEGVPRPSVSSAGTGARGFVAARGVVGMLPGAVVVVSPGRLLVPVTADMIAARTQQEIQQTCLSASHPFSQRLTRGMRAA